MRNIYNSPRYGEMIVRTDNNNDIPSVFNTKVTMESLKNEKCGKLLDAVCTTRSMFSDYYTCDTVRTMERKAEDVLGIIESTYIFKKIVSDAYISRDYLSSLPDYSIQVAEMPYSTYADDEAVRMTLAKNLGNADCLAYRASTNEVAILDASGELKLFQLETESVGEIAGAKAEL